MVFIAGDIMQPDRRFSSNDELGQRKGELGFYIS